MTELWHKGFLSGFTRCEVASDMGATLVVTTPRGYPNIDTQVLRHEAPEEWWWRADVSATYDDGLTRCELWRLFPPTDAGHAAAVEWARGAAVNVRRLMRRVEGP